MKINPLKKDIFSNKIDSCFNIFYIFGNNLGLIDICYSKLRNNLKIDLNDPFTTNYFDEYSLLKNTQSFFYELDTIPVFGENKSIIVDIRQSEKKSDVAEIFNNFDFSEIKNTQLIILSYSLKQTDTLSKKIMNSKNAICITCYEEDEYNVKSNLKKELAKINLKLNELQIDELINRLSKDSKLIQNTFNKIRLLNKSNNINFDQLLSLIDDNNDKNIFEMINKLMTGNYYESVRLLKSFELLNNSSISILYLMKNKFKLLKKCIDMKENGLTKKQIVN